MQKSPKTDHPPPCAAVCLLSGIDERQGLIQSQACVFWPLLFKFWGIGATLSRRPSWHGPRGGGGRGVFASCSSSSGPLAMRAIYSNSAQFRSHWTSASKRHYFSDDIKSPWRPSISVPQPNRGTRGEEMLSRGQ